MKVLFATDGFPAADRARTLLEKAARRDIELIVASVAPVGMPTPDEIPLVLDSRATRESQAREIASAAAEELRAQGFRVEDRVDEGDPAHELLKTIEAEAVEIVVVGAGSRSWLGNLLLGSTSTRLLHSVPTSVLLVHEAPDAERLKVLVATDGSRGAASAMDRLVGFADPARCDVTVLSVAPHPPPMLVTPPATYVVYEHDEEVMAELKARAERAAEAATGRLSDAGFTVGSVVVSGHAPTEIVREAQERSVDLVVVGSRGLGAVRRALLGSVSDHVARHTRASLISH